MTNNPASRTQHVHIHNTLLTPTQADVLCTWDTTNLPTDTMLHGKLNGPSCPYSSTIEIAYRLQRIDAHSGRFIIPEPSLWDPISPFLYRGNLELRSGDTVHTRIPITHGLCAAAHTSTGWHWNGQPIHVRGLARPAFGANDIPVLRDDGYNTILAPFDTYAEHLLASADHCGMWVLFTITNEDIPSADICRRPSCLGFVLDGAAITDAQITAISAMTKQQRRLVGVTPSSMATLSNIPAHAFLLGTADDDTTRPKLVWATTMPSDTTAQTPDLGFIQR